MISNNYLRIKDLAEEDRPREKLLAKGISSLTDAELIAILIGTGSKNESAVDLGKKILGSVSHNLNELGKLSIHDLMKMKGIGQAKAITILAALELGRRRKASEIIKKRKISQSRDVLEYFQPLLSDLHYEEFWVLLLNRSNRVVNKIKISQGGISGTVIDVRLILKKAIENDTSSIILCHNHPSGNLEPSESDKKITLKLQKAGQLMDIQVIDHVIISDNNYFSFADEGLLT